MKEEIKKAIIKYKENLPKDIYKRELEILEMRFDKAVVIVGPRRAGKSYFLYNLAKKEDNPIYITGSNTRLLSKEIATALRGKAISYLMLPLSFIEYLKLKNIDIEKN